VARTEWLRTFVSAYQAGSISEAARLRHLSQPAATSHIRSLEAAAGTPLFVRRRDGVVPTEEGRRLFAEIADPLDRLSSVLAGLDGGSLPMRRSPLRVGSSPEVFAGLVVRHLGVASSPVTAVFGSDEDLLAGVLHDEIDVAVTPTPVARKAVVSDVVGHYRYALVAPGTLRARPASLEDLAAAVSGTPWVAYSSDLPRTRRLWKQHLGRTFDADLRLVAPDLRVVLSAVEAGLGTSLLPTLVCGPAIERGSVIEPFSVRDLVQPRPLWATARASVADQPEVAALLSALRRSAG
jgi:DNA-binding transcriptional LysR family regulator